MASRIFRVLIKETRQSALNLSVATHSLAILSHCKKLCFDRTCPGKPVNPAFSLADVWAGVTHYRQVAPRDFTMNLALFVFNFCKIKADSGAKKWEKTTFLEILKFLHESQIYGWRHKSLVKDHCLYEWTSTVLIFALGRTCFPY